MNKYTSFCLFIYKNCNIRVIMAAVCMSIAKAYLFNIFLVIFNFLIKNAQAVVVNISGCLKVLNFSFFFIKIVKPWLKMEICQQVYWFFFFC